MLSGAASGSETAAYTHSNNTLTVSIASGVSTTTAVASAISALTGQFSASVVSAGTLGGRHGRRQLVHWLDDSASNISNLQINQANFGTQSSIRVDVKVNAQATQGTLTYSGGTLTSNVVLQVGGDSGYNVFNFDSGTTVAQIESGHQWRLRCDRGQCLSRRQRQPGLQLDRLRLQCLCLGAGHQRHL